MTTVAMSTLERRLADAVEEDAFVAAVRALVAIPTWGGGETPAQERMAAWMGEAGLDVDRWDIDLAELARHPDYSAELEREGAVGVVGTLKGGGGGRSLILNGHIDVVPPGEPALWSDPPFAGTLRDGRIWGRGALDMKSGLLAGLYALRAIRAAGVTLAGDVHLMSVVGEEDGGMGTLASVLRGYRADGAIVMEPTEMAVSPAQAGCLNFRLRIPGLSAHGAVREEGVDALEKLALLHGAIRALEEERNRRLGDDPLFARYRLPYPICMGTVHGGDWPSSVADHVTVEGRYGLAPEEAPDAARRELERAVEAAAEGDPFLRDHRPSLTWWGGRFQGARTPTDHPLVTTLREAGSEVAGRTLPLEGMTYGADMGKLAGLGGTPTVMFGPGDIRLAHRPDEHVEVAEMVAVARALAVAAVRFCGVS